MEKGSIMIVATCIVSFAYLASGIPGIATFSPLEDMMSSMSRICDDITPNGVMVAAAGEPFGFDKSKCGRLYSVRCTGVYIRTENPCTDKNVTVMVVYASGYSWALDLQSEAFNIIANSEMTHLTNIIDIDYELI